jgi:hypothetical protein
MNLSPQIEETIVLDFITSAASRAAADADSTPTCKVFESTTDTAILTPTVVKRTGETGNYRVPVACTTANGFEVGKSYNVVAIATVGGVVGKAVIARFQVRDIRPEVNLTRLNGLTVGPDGGAVPANLIEINGVPAAVETGNIPADLKQINGANFLTSDLLGTMTVVSSVSDTTPAGSNFDGHSSLSANESFYVGSILAFTGGGLKGLARRISGYTGTTRNFQFVTPFPSAPANGDTFVIFGRID